MKIKFINLSIIFSVIIVLASSTIIAQSPTAAAKDFNVFTLGNSTLKTNETEGPIAIGGDLTIDGNYQVAIHNAGTFKVNNVKIGLLVNGKVNYQSGSSLQVNSNGYVKIGNSTGSTVWYADPNNATPPIRITPTSNYNSSPIIMLQANAPSLGVSVNNNPVFQSNLLDFASAFQTMKATSLSISQCTANVQLTNPNGQSIPTTNLPNQVKINLQNGINYWNISASDLNAVQIITFNNKPSASKVLVINVNAPGTFNWNVWNQAGIGFQDSPYILYNFYNTTQLNITNGSTIEGTIFAPFADIFKGLGNQSNIEGQVIANSFSHSGGEVHYALFSPSVSGCAVPPVVGVAPTANFSVANSTQCLASNSFVFTNETTPIQADYPLTYLWEFGDGTTSTAENPTKVYSASGTYNVKLTANNSIGSSSKTVQVIVNGSTEAVVTQSVINGPSTLVRPTVTKQFVLNNSSDFTSYSWSASNSTRTGLFANRSTVTFAFTQAGVYEVTVTGVNANGCSSITRIPVSIAFVGSGVAPTANFTVDNSTQCLSGNSFNFTNATTPVQVGLPLSYLWEFGDGTTSTDANPTKVYAVAGTYNAKLTATNSIGSSSKTVQVTVNSSTDAVVNQSTLANVIGSITKQFVLSNVGDFTNYSWSVSNGGTGLFSNQNTVNFTFTQAGVYQVTVTGINDKGCSSTTIIPVSIASILVGVAPTADFSVVNASQCLATNSFDFTNATTPLQVGLPLTYLWEFGDGTTSTFLNPTKVYSVAGTYNVKLTATNALGSSSKTTQVTVNSATDAVVSQSTLSNAAGTLTKQFVLTNSSDFTNYSWSVSNGASGLFSNQSTVTFPFTLAGYYEVTVTGTNDKGCSSSTVIPVTIATNEVNTGNSGGLESESLGDIMSQQYVSRKMKSIPTEFVKNDATKFDKSKLIKESSSNQRANKELSMAEMFPATLQSGNVADITSPTDILDYTIAQEVLSVDFSVQGATKAVVLGVRTKDRVYNHTKASCDRLKGAEILNVKTIKVGGYNFLIQAIKQKNKVVEYAISFCVGKNYSDSAYSLQSNWFVKEFTPYKDVYNFQVWATLPEQTIKLVNDILNNLRSSMPLVQTEVGKLPKTFASKVTREGNELVLKLKSTQVEKSIEINMDQNYSETNGFTERYNPLKSEIDQTIALNVDDAYEFDGLIKVEGEIQDAFYHADGNWGLDFDEKYTKINNYRVSNNLDRIATDDDLLINRNVHLEVFSEGDYATLYKSLLPGQQPADYNDYKFVSFKAKGSGLMELGLIKSSVENWKHQYKGMINIGEEEKTYYVPFKFFTSSNSKETLNANDLTMLTFTFLPVEAKTKNLDLTISDVKFSKKAPDGYEDLLSTMQNEFLVYPNPSLGNVKCVLFSDAATTASVLLYDITGKVVFASEIKLNEGKNELDLNFNVPKGVMLLSIKNEKNNFGTSKIVIK